jgi:hypothetical protein
MRKAGGFRIGYEGSQDWDLAFRVATFLEPRQIQHIPRVLYHWRTIPSSTSTSSEAKPYAAIAGLKTVTDFLDSHDARTAIACDEMNRHCLTWPLPQTLPGVTLLILSENLTASHRAAISQLLSNTVWEKLEILLMLPDGLHLDQPANDWLAANDSIKLTPVAHSASTAAAYQAAAHQATGEIVVLMRPYLHPENSNWLEDLVRQAMRKNAGAVGPCVINESNCIHSAGLVLDQKLVVREAFQNGHLSATTYAGRPDLVRQVSAVSGICIAMLRDNLLGLQGLQDLPKLPSFWNVDLCLRLRAAGKMNLYTPHARLNVTDDAVQLPAEAELRKETTWMQGTWRSQLAKDAFANPNLSYETNYPKLGTWNAGKPWLAAEGR